MIRNLFFFCFNRLMITVQAFHTRPVPPVLPSTGRIERQAVASSWRTYADFEYSFPWGVPPTSEYKNRLDGSVESLLEVLHLLVVLPQIFPLLQFYFKIFLLLLIQEVFVCIIIIVVFVCKKITSYF
jgi:hypothetical protein